jgi:hypothetical protein
MTADRDVEGPGAGQTRLWSVELTPAVSGYLLLGSLLLFGGAAAGFGWLTVRLHAHSDLSVTLGLAEVVCGLVLTLVAHEGVHALAFAAFGGRPRFGAGMRGFIPVLVTRSPGVVFTRNQFLVVGLAPLVLLDVIGLLLLLPDQSAPFGLTMLIINTAGAVGDLWMVGVLAQCPRWARAEDTELGFDVWAPAERVQSAPGLRQPLGLNPPLGRWVGLWTLLTFAVFFVLLVGGALVLARPIALVPVLALAVAGGGALTGLWAATDRWLR